MRAAVLLLIISISLLSLGPMPLAEQLTVISVPVSYTMNGTFTLSATNTSANLSFTMPWALTPEDKVQVHYSVNSTSLVTLKVYDENSTLVKTVQLSAGPGDTIILPLSTTTNSLIISVENATALGTEVWSGTITIEVTSTLTVDVYGYPTGKITMEPGKIYGFKMYVKHKTGPSGSFTVSTIFSKNGKTTYDMTATADPSFWSSRPGKIQPVSITLKAGQYASGTYTGKIKIYFTSDARTPTGAPVIDNAKVAELSFDPITVGTIVGGSSLLFGSILGAGMGIWGVALAGALVFIAIAIILTRR